MAENLGNNNDVYLPPISHESTKKILESMEKCVCSIIYKNTNIGTGFFCKLPIPDQQTLTPFLITNNHIINDNLLNQGNEKITIITKEVRKSPIELALNIKERLSFSFPQYGITLIEIKEKDKIKHFFEVDEINPNNNGINQYKNTHVYMIQNKEIKEKKVNEVYVSFGTLKQLEKDPKYFNHTCKTFSGSSGSPIINLNNHKLIGIQSDNVSGYFLNIFSVSSSTDKIDYEYKLNITHRGSSKDLAVKRKLTNEIDISNKKGFINLGSYGNKSLNSIIQMLTSIGEIKNILDPDVHITEDGKKNNIERFDNIYILSSFLRKVFVDAYQVDNKIENVSLKPMNIILNFLNKDISNLSTFDFLLFILNTLHEELISYPDNIPRTGKLKSFNSQVNELEKSKEQFNNYYSTQYFKSIISDLFNWIRREERFCFFCNAKIKEKKFSYSFQAFPIISFDLDEIITYITQQKLEKSNSKSLDLLDAFNIYPLMEYKLDKEKEKCIFCGKGCLTATYSIETSPKYFIIVINRKNKQGFTYGKKLEFKEEEGKGIHYEYKKYELISVIMHEKDKWSCAVKNCEYEKITDFKTNKLTKFEEWIKFQDENVNNITFEKDENNKNEEIYDPYNAKILVYKGIKAN